MTLLAEPSASVRVDFDTAPDRYRHWRLSVDGAVATLTLLVDEQGGIVPGYELKMNSYDLGVDIELYDAVQRLRFEHPGVKAVVLTGGLDRMFCAGANIKMLAQSPHSWKVNFCKFTNETRNGIEDATAHSGQTWVAALNGTAAGGGYEMALACEQIVLVDDGSSSVSLPEVPLLGVLPGTGGLTRVVDKRFVRKDRADVFASKTEGVRGATAVEWGLVDESVPLTRFAAAVQARADKAAAHSFRPDEGEGVVLTPLAREETEDGLRYPHVTAIFDRPGRRVDVTVQGPAGPPPDGAHGVHAQGVDWWPMAVARELDDLVLRLRTNELDLGTWVFRTRGDSALVLAHDAQLAALADDWFVNEVSHFWKRTLKRLDVTSRSLFAVVEPGSCFAGSLLELALACDRQYMLDGVLEDVDPDAEPAVLTVGQTNLGAYEMGNGLTRLQSRFWGRPAELDAVAARVGEPLDAAAASALGLVTSTPDDLDWDDELRLALEERASLSPDALTGMEANHRFVGPETVETKVFGRLTAWQNWVFLRPNASGPDGALRRFGSGTRAAYDTARVEGRPHVLDVDLLLVGAGPVGLYGAYYAGVRGLRTALVDSLPEPGGQVTALYPEKPIYDVGGFPAVRGRDLVAGLVAQAGQYAPTYVLGESATTLQREGDRLVVGTDAGSLLRCGAVVLTGGIGTFTPRPLPAGEEFLGRGLDYFVPRLADHAGADVVVVGGGDSACDWALALQGVARSVTLVHRRKAFRAHAGTVAAVHASATEVVTDAQLTAVLGADAVDAVEVTVKGEAVPRVLPCQRVVAALGFLADLGPVREWGLELHDNRHVVVDTRMRTSVPGVYAAGDITDYDGKVRLISVGFGEVATAVNNAAVELDPDAQLFPGHSSDAAPAPAAVPSPV